MKKTTLLLALAGLVSLPVLAEISAKQAEVMNQLIANYAGKVKADAVAMAKGKPPVVEQFTAEKGRQIYMMSRTWEGDEQPACSTCHTDDPKLEGKHAVSKKPISPLAPTVNAERFTSAEKVEKNFSKHCRELYNRDCTVAEKGHFLTYLLSVK